MFLDADTLVYGKIDHYFDYVDNNSLLIEYFYNGHNGWAGIK